LGAVYSIGESLLGYGHGCTQIDGISRIYNVFVSFTTTTVIREDCHQGMPLSPQLPEIPRCEEMSLLRLLLCVSLISQLQLCVHSDIAAWCSARMSHILDPQEGKQPCFSISREDERYEDRQTHLSKTDEHMVDLSVQLFRQPRL